MTTLCHNDPFSKAWQNLPDAVQGALTNLGIHGRQQDAELFRELWREDPDELVQEVKRLIPESMCVALPEALIKTTFEQLLKRAESTADTCDMAEWQMVAFMEDWAKDHDRLRLPRALNTTELEKALAKWRHWKPNPKNALNPLTQRQIEIALVDKWLTRLLAMFVNKAKQIPRMAQFLGYKDPAREWKDLFGNARFSSVRGHTKGMEEIHRENPDFIPCRPVGMGHVEQIQRWNLVQRRHSGCGTQ